MKLVFSLIAALGLFVSGAAAQNAPKKSALDKAAFEAYIRQLELLPANLKVVVGDPKPTIYDQFLEVPVEVATPQGNAQLRYYVTKDGRNIVKGSLYDINTHPFQPELNRLKTDLQPSFGTPGASVVIVVFTDFQCPNCREEAKVLRQNLTKTFPDKVRVYFKDFPLEQIHPWARPAAVAGRCIFRQQPTAFWDFHDWIFEHQPEITADNLKTKVIGWAQEKNMDVAKLGQCIDNNATVNDIDREIAEGKSLAVNGTPTMFINGRPLQGAIPWQTLEQIIQRELAVPQAASSQTAGEKCCEVTIPSLAPKK
jgi:protein-disulfide isomerase